MKFAHQKISHLLGKCILNIWNSLLLVGQEAEDIALWAVGVWLPGHKANFQTAQLVAFKEQGSHSPAVGLPALRHDTAFKFSLLPSAPARAGLPLCCSYACTCPGTRLTQTPRGWRQTYLPACLRLISDLPLGCRPDRTRPPGSWLGLAVIPRPDPLRPVGPPSASGSPALSEPPAPPAAPRHGAWTRLSLSSASTCEALTMLSGSKALLLD